MYDLASWNLPSAHSVYCLATIRLHSVFLSSKALLNFFLSASSPFKGIAQLGKLFACSLVEPGWLTAT